MMALTVKDSASAPSSAPGSPALPGIVDNGHLLPMLAVPLDRLSVRVLLLARGIRGKLGVEWLARLLMDPRRVKVLGLRFHMGGSKVLDLGFVWGLLLIGIGFLWSLGPYGLRGFIAGVLGLGPMDTGLEFRAYGKGLAGFNVYRALGLGSRAYRV